MYNPATSNFRSMAPGARRLAALAAAGLVLASGLVEGNRWWARRDASAAVAVSEPVASGLLLRQLSSTLIPMPSGVPAAHASSLAVLPGGDMLAFWFAGARESAPDVQIFSARWSRGAWGPAAAVTGRAALGEALGFGVRRIGNPTAWTAPDGRVHLFVVATGLGGWAASRVAHLVSSDAGKSFQPRRVLPLSPLFNTSVLVRTSPVGLVDGGWLLPVHFEISRKFPMVVAFDSRGEPRWLARIGKRTTVLQPSLVAVSPREVRALMRDISQQQRIQQAVSRDGGASWEDLPATSLSNANASVAALRLRDGGFVLLHNHVADGTSSRNLLRLSIANDAQTWNHALDVAQGPAEKDEYSYPSLQQIGDQLHVTYTHQRRAIAHQVYQISYAVLPR